MWVPLTFVDIPSAGKLLLGQGCLIRALKQLNIPLSFFPFQLLCSLGKALHQASYNVTISAKFHSDNMEMSCRRSSCCCRGCLIRVLNQLNFPPSFFPSHLLCYLGRALHQASSI